MAQDHENEKKQAAEAALAYLPLGGILGVGTGSTSNYFIEALASRKDEFQGAIPSSEETARRLKALKIPLLDPNSHLIDVYVDGADEASHLKQLIKGGGGALTREKILATIAVSFVCIIDSSKYHRTLGNFPLAIEVHPMARSYVARQMLSLGGSPVYREGFITDNGNVILDVHHLDFSEPLALETKLNNITGLIAHGLFAKRSPDVILIGTATGIEVLS